MISYLYWSYSTRFSSMEVPILELLLVISLTCTNEIISTSHECHSSTFGKEFVFGIAQPISTKYPSRHITLDIFSEKSGSVHIDAAYIQLNATYYVSAETYLTIPFIHHALDGTFQQHRGIRITCSTDISVLLSQTDNSNFKTSQFILPTVSLGHKYVVASYSSSTGYEPKIMIVATQNNSNILLNVKGKVTHITLNELDVYQYQSAQITDVSGTIIQSNKPVAVFTACLEYISINTSFNVISAQIVPVSSWSKEFIVTSNKRIVLRIFAETYTINLSFRNHSNAMNITQHKITDYIFDSEPLTLVADRPVFVVQYMTNPPAMFTVPGVDHFVNNYAFIMPYKDDAMSGYVSITVPSNQAAGLLYDGLSFHKSLQPVAVPFNDYVVATFNMTTEKIHKVSHIDSSVNFGLMVTRYSSIHFAFGFYVGSTVEGNCNVKDLQTTVFTTMPSTTMPSTTMPSTTMPSISMPSTTMPSISMPSTTMLSTTMPSTTISLTTSMPGTSTVSNQGQICYSCEGMSHLQYCDSVVRCQENEKCFVQRYTQSGKIIFRSGCMMSETCQLQNTKTSSSVDGCVTCCDGNVCNGKGCNDHGLPSLDNRGPVCYDCEHVGSPDECELVTLCDIDEQCMVEKFKWGSAFHYKLGCGSHTCSLRSGRDVHVPATRSLPVCHKCCDNDICNRDCSSHASPEIVG